MNQRIIAAWKPLAVIGLAFALAGCNKATTGAAGTTTGATTTAGGDTLATVGDTPITRADLDTLLEAQAGQQVLPNLIDFQLLSQKAKEEGVTVSDAEVAAELDRQKKIEPQLAELLTKNPMLLTLANQQFRRDLLVQGILTKGVKAPTDAELQKFFDTYKSYFQDPTTVNIGALVTSSKARADAMSRALKDKTTTFEQLVAEQKKAKDPAAGSSRVKDQPVSVENLPQVVGPREATTLENLPLGGTTEPIPITPPSQPGAPPTPTVYVLYHITERKEAPALTLASMKPVVVTDYKLAQVAQGVVKANPQNPPFEQTVKTTRSFLYDQKQRAQQQNPFAPPPKQPTLRDTLNYILEKPSQAILTDLRGKGIVKINDPSYSSVADRYKAVPTSAPIAPGSAAPGNAAIGNAAPATDSAAPAPATDSAAPAPATNAAPAPAADAAPAPATNAAPAPAANAATANAVPAAP